MLIPQTVPKADLQKTVQKMIQSDAKGCRESSSCREEWLSSAGVRHILDRYCRRFYKTVTKTLQSPSSYLTHLKSLRVETVSANEGKEGGGRQACWWGSAWRRLMDIVILHKEKHPHARTRREVAFECGSRVRR